MKTFEDVSEVTNKCLMRCAGVVRKDGWPQTAIGMYVGLSGPTFYYQRWKSILNGYYEEEYIYRFMKWQEETFS